MKEADGRKRTTSHNRRLRQYLVDGDTYWQVMHSTDIAANKDEGYFLDGVCVTSDYPITFIEAGQFCTTLKRKANATFY